MNGDKLIARLRELADWAESEIWEVPIDLPDLLRQAADGIEKFEYEYEVERSDG